MTRLTMLLLLRLFIRPRASAFHSGEILHCSI